MFLSPKWLSALDDAYSPQPQPPHHQHQRHPPQSPPTLASLASSSLSLSSSSSSALRTRVSSTSPTSDAVRRTQALARQGRAAQQARQQQHHLATRHQNGSTTGLLSADVGAARAVDALHGFLPDAAQLVMRTGFSREQLYNFWLQFKALCIMSGNPKGVDLAAFKRHVPSVVLEDDAFTGRLFKVLDRTGLGYVNWPDFCEAMASMGDMDTEKRAGLLFKVYDTRECGQLAKDDLFKFFAASLGLSVPPGYDPEVELRKAEEGAPLGSSPLEGVEGVGALLLCSALFSEMTYLLLQEQGGGAGSGGSGGGGSGGAPAVTLKSTVNFLRDSALGMGSIRSSGGGGSAVGGKVDVGKIFGRSLLNSIESDSSKTLSGSHRQMKAAEVTEEAIKSRSYRMLLEELLPS